MRSKRLRLLASGLVVAAVASSIAPASAGPTRAERRKGLKLGADAGSPTKESEAAVDRALDWLARSQHLDGHWDGEGKFERGDPGMNTDPGVTGLALLALLAEGNSEVSGAYSDNVRRGVRWLISKQERDGAIGRGYEGYLGYHHAIAGLALIEACGMSKTAATRRAAQKAVDYSTGKHQARSSGWRYNPAQSADMSVTGWFVQQLSAAMSAGLKVDGKGFRGAAAFLDTCAKPDGKVSYQPERAPTPCMTAVGMHCWQLMGRKRTDRRLSSAADYVAQKVPSWRGGGGVVDFYHWYFGTLAMYHHGGRHWLAWGRAIRETLVKHQRKGKPAIDGSWDPFGAWCGQGGRVYATAMAALCLEVSYRQSRLRR